MEQRHVVVAQVVHAVGGGEAGGGQRLGHVGQQRFGHHHAGVVVTVPNQPHFIGNRRTQLLGRHQPHRRLDPFAAHAAAGLRGDTGVRQQAIGDIEDGGRHAVADGEVRHLGGTRSHETQRVGPVLLPGRSGALREVAEDGHRTCRAAPADAPQRDRAVILRFVDHHVAVRERGAHQQRVGFVDQELIGRGPRALLAARPGQQLVDQLHGCLRGPRLRERCTQRGALLPHVVAVVAAQHVALHHALQRVAPLVDRRVGRQRLLEPPRHLIAGDGERACPDGHPQVVVGHPHVGARCHLQREQHLLASLVAPLFGGVDAGDGHLRHAQIQCRSLLHAALAQ